MKPTPKGILIVVSGPSGSGKSTLIERFLREDDRSTFSVSYTTRERREHEVEGKSYHFVGKEQFEDMVKTNRFLEWENVHAYMYGTPREEILSTLETGRDIILDIDVKGALAIRKQCARARLIFIDPPSVEELIRRLQIRGEREIDLRMTRVKEEIARKPLFGYTVVNRGLEQAYREFKETIAAIRREADGTNNC